MRHLHPETARAARGCIANIVSDVMSLRPPGQPWSNAELDYMRNLMRADAVEAFRQGLPEWSEGKRLELIEVCNAEFDRLIAIAQAGTVQ